MTTQVTFDFAGKALNAIVTENQEVYLTLQSISQLGSGSSQQALKWAAKYKQGVETLNFKSGVRSTLTRAFPSRLCVEYLIYRLSLGDKEALATFSATMLADLERSAKEASGIQVTAAQHEETRTVERERILKAFIEAKLGISKDKEAAKVHLPEEDYRVWSDVSEVIYEELDLWSRRHCFDANHDVNYAKKKQELYGKAMQSVGLN